MDCSGSMIIHDVGACVGIDFRRTVLILQRKNYSRRIYALRYTTSYLDIFLTHAVILVEVAVGFSLRAHAIQISNTTRQNKLSTPYLARRQDLARYVSGSAVWQTMRHV